MKKAMMILIILVGMFTFSFAGEKRVEKQTKVKKKINYKVEYDKLKTQKTELKQKLIVLRKQHNELKESKKIIKIEYDTRLADLKKCKINVRKLKEENQKLRSENKEMKAKLYPEPKKKIKKLKKVDL